MKELEELKVALEAWAAESKQAADDMEEAKNVSVYMYWAGKYVALRQALSIIEELLAKGHGTKMMEEKEGPSL